MDPDVFTFAPPSQEFLDTQKAFEETYGDYYDGEKLRDMSQRKDEIAGRPGAEEYVKKLDEKINTEDARLRAEANKANEAKRKQALEKKAQADSVNAVNAIKDSLYQEHLKKLGEEEGDDLPTFAPTKQHGQSKGDQSATHTDYANYKGTDKGYHGRTGASHGDQSATHRDYAHPILKHMKR